MAIITKTKRLNGPI